jgi:hypothetical protein
MKNQDVSGQWDHFFQLEAANDIVEALSGELREFPANEYMQHRDYALMVHFQNLVSTYGEDAVYSFMKDLVRGYETNK